MGGPRDGSGLACVGSEKADARKGMSTEIVGVRDVFPELGEGFVLACLEAYGGSVERVVGRLLEGSLSGDLDELPRDTPLAVPHRMSVLQGRANVFDGDDFDVLGGGRVLDKARVRVRGAGGSGEVGEMGLDSGGGEDVKLRTLAGVWRMQAEECKREVACPPNVSAPFTGCPGWFVAV